MSLRALGGGERMPCYFYVILMVTAKKLPYFSYSLGAPKGQVSRPRQPDRGGLAGDAVPGDILVILTVTTEKLLYVTYCLGSAGELHPLFFGQRLDAELSGFAGLGAGILADYHETGLLRHRVGDLGAQLLGARFGGVARHRGELAGEDHDLVRERRVGGDPAALHALDGELIAQVADDLAIVAFAEEGADRVGRGDADLLDVAEAAVALAHFGGGLLLLDLVRRLLAFLGGLQHLGQPHVYVAVLLRHDLGRRLADQRDADGVDQAVERDGTAIIDRLDEIVDRQIAPAFTLLDLIASLGEAEDVTGDLEQPVVEEVLDVRAAQPFYVEAVARHEVAQPLDLLKRAFQPARAAPHHAALLALDPGLQGTGAVGGEAELLGLLRSLLRHIAQHLRHDVAGPLHHHHVAGTHVQPLDFVGIPQRGARHHDAADIDRLEVGPPGERAGAAGPEGAGPDPAARLRG